jgi:protein phosphatase
MTPQPPLGLLISALSRRGRRPVNEDHLAYHVPPDLTTRAHKGILFVVADGVGGHQAGQVASRLAAQTVLQQYYYDGLSDPWQSLQRAILTAHRAVVAQAQQHRAYAGMNTTLLAVVVRGSQLWVAHVGDGRAYLMRGPRIWRLTRDHTWMAQLQESGALQASQVASHPYRHVLTQALGGSRPPQVELRGYGLQPGDALLLCTDGVYEWVRSNELGRALKAGPVARAVAQLATQALRRGSPDNLSAVVVRVAPVAASGAQFAALGSAPPRRRGARPLGHGGAMAAGMLMPLWAQYALGWGALWATVFAIIWLMTRVVR